MIHIGDRDLLPWRAWPLTQEVVQVCVVSTQGGYMLPTLKGEEVVG